MSRRLLLVTEVAVAVGVVTVGWWGFEVGAAPDVGRFNTALLTGVFAALATVAIVAGWRRPTDGRPHALLAAVVVFTVSFFRFLQPPWLAVVGTFVWLATPLLVLTVLTAPTRSGRAAPPRWRGTAALVTVAVVTVLVSGPRSGSGWTARRALSWAHFDPDLERWVRQPNPLAILPSDAATTMAWLAWVALLVVAAVPVVRRLRGRWWRWITVIVVIDNVVLAAPARLGPGESLVSWYGDLLVAVSIAGVGVFAAWAVWAELITPRLSRPEALVLQLDPTTTLEATSRRLAMVLGDPSARVVFVAPSGWVDGRGRLADGRDRRRVVVTRAGEPVAAIDLDALTHVAPDLLADAAGSLAVSLEAQRLAALAKAAAIEARETARHVLDVDREVVDAVDRRLGAGPQRTLADVDRLLDARPLPLDEIHDAFRHALEELRAIAHRSSNGGQDADVRVDG